MTGFVVTRPCNFPKAIKLPVKVSVPTRTLSVIVSIKNVVGLGVEELIDLKNSAEATRAEAAPPKPLNIATS